MKKADKQHKHICLFIFALKSAGCCMRQPSNACWWSQILDERDSPP